MAHDSISLKRKELCSGILIKAITVWREFSPGDRILEREREKKMHIVKSNHTIDNSMESMPSSVSVCVTTSHSLWIWFILYSAKFLYRWHAKRNRRLYLHESFVVYCQKFIEISRSISAKPKTVALSNQLNWKEFIGR